MIRAELKVMFWAAALLVASVGLLVLRDVLTPFLVGLVVAYALNPLADWLERRGLPRTLASALIVAMLVLAIVAAAVVLLPQLTTQVQQLLKTMPSDIDRLRTVLEDYLQRLIGPRAVEVRAAIDKGIADVTANWSSVLPTLASSLLNSGRSLIGAVSLALITPLVVFYLLVDWHTMLGKVESWLPRQHAATIHRLAVDIDDAIAAFIRGQGLVCLILAVFYSIALTAAGVRYSLLIGIVTGVLAFVPFVGWALGLITTLIVAAAQFWPDAKPMLIVLAIFAAGQALDAGLLSPQIVGSKIGLHPVWLLLALAVFSFLFGLVGLLVAVPLAAATGVLVRHTLKLYLASPLYRSDGETGPGS